MAQAPVPAAPTPPDCINNVPSTLPTVIIIAVVVLCVVWLVVEAIVEKRGARWLATLFGGILFGEVAEALNVNTSGNHLYCYPNLPAINWLFGVPFWVPVGWGGIIYASTWTARRLRLPPLGRALTAAFLAASIDFSLDPIAELFRFWQWQSVPVSFCGVPYDNYIGWYLIVFIYSLTASIVLGLTKARWNVATTLFTWPWWKSVGVQWIGAFVCAGFATLALVAAGWALSKSGYSSSGGNGKSAAEIFIVVTALAAVVTLVLAGRPSARAAAATSVAPANASFSWPIMVVPQVIHVTCYGLFLVFATWSDAPMLIASIPLQLLAGALLFSTPWQRKLP